MKIREEAESSRAYGRKISEKAHENLKIREEAEPSRACGEKTSEKAHETDINKKLNR